jgi:hypothetical protein
MPSPLYLEFINFNVDKKYPLYNSALQRLISVSEMRNFLQGQGNQGIVRRHTISMPHKLIPKIDVEIAEKGRF